MKKIAFIVSITGIFSLFLLMFFLPIKVMNSMSDLDNIADNSRVSLSGLVVRESKFGSSSLLVLKNGFEIVCSCKTSYKNKNVAISGYIDDFSGKKRIIALKIMQEKAT